MSTAFRAADRVTGHQFTSDLGVLANASPDPLPAVATARETWRNRGNHDLADRRVIDTRYDTDHVLNCRSHRLVDVCTELRLDVTQPELRGTSMTPLHPAWLTDRIPEARDRISVLNLRYSLSPHSRPCGPLTGPIGRAPSTSTACWPPGLDGAFTWLDHPIFTDLLW